jgi:hypothetical protein
MKSTLFILCLVLLAGCDDPAPKAGTENMGDPSHFEECHKHDTFGAYTGAKRYCLVPIERMKEMDAGNAKDEPYRPANKFTHGRDTVTIPPNCSILSCPNAKDEPR